MSMGAGRLDRDRVPGSNERFMGRRHRRMAGMGVLLVVASMSAGGQFGPSGPSVSVEGLLSTDGPHAGDTLRIAARVTLDEGWHVNAHEPLDKFLIPTILELKPPEGMTLREMVYPEPEPIALEGTSETLAAYGAEFVVGIEVALAESLQPGAYELKGDLRYQACDTKQCLPPKSVAVTIPITVAPGAQPGRPQHQAVFAAIPFGTSGPSEEPAGVTAVPAEDAPVEPITNDWRALAAGFTVTGRETGYLGVAGFLTFLDSVERGAPRDPAGPFAGKGLWLVLLSVIGGGLLLNLTPCVLPLIPINLAIIGAGAKASSRTRGFLLGATYGAGIALAYGVLGLVVILGVSSTFGAINATPWFNGAIAVIFVILALAMFDVFLIDFTRFQSTIGLAKGGGGFVVAFSMGVIAALLAGACVAPVIISAIVYAQDQYAKGAPAALLLPFLVGVGMALPWPFAGAGLSFLPKPGKWMVRVKYAFGVLILGFALYYGHLSYSLFSNRYLGDPEATQAAISQMDEQGWQSLLVTGLDQARQEGKPILVDFWATWCKNCLTMNKTTFKDPEVVARLEGYVKVKYQAENPADPATQAVLEYFGVTGLPTYVVLSGEPNEGPPV